MKKIHTYKNEEGVLVVYIPGKAITYIKNGQMYQMLIQSVRR